VTFALSAGSVNVSIALDTLCPLLDKVSNASMLSVDNNVGIKYGYGNSIVIYKRASLTAQWTIVRPAQSKYSIT
jgi:hypothetical protein